MFIGHYALGLVLWLDDYPISHSLLALLVWGALFGYLYRLRTGDRRW